MTFNVGDEVCVGRSMGRPSVKKMRVEKLFKRYLQCDDGSKWYFNGSPYGKGNSWRSSLVHWGEDNDTEVLRCRVKHLWEHRKNILNMKQLLQLLPILENGGEE